MSLGAAMDIRFPETVPEFLDFAVGLGLDHLELKREYLHAHPEAPGPAEVRELAASYDVTVTYHAPFRDWNIGSFNEASRAASVAQVCDTLDDAAAAGAGAVVVHGGSVPRRYPEHVRESAEANARRSLEACAAHAADVGVPLCLENQPLSTEVKRYTTGPDALASWLAGVDVDPAYLGVTLDVGHAKVNGHDWRAFRDRLGDRIRVVHLHDNDGSEDRHEPFPGYGPVVEAVGADFFVFEMKRPADLARCLGRRPTPGE